MAVYCVYIISDLGHVAPWFKANLPKNRNKQKKSVAQGKSPGTKIDRNVSELRDSFVQFLALPRKFPDWIPDSPLVHPSGRFIKAENLSNGFQFQSIWPITLTAAVAARPGARRDRGGLAALEAGVVSGLRD